MALLDLVALFFSRIVGVFPEMHTIPDWFSAFISVLQIGLYFFPADVLVIIIANVMFCNISLVGWSVIEWVYKKIPGIS